MSGCGDDATPPADGAAGPRYHLEILDPPGDQIGLAFLATAQLRVRLTDDGGRSAGARAVMFMIDPGTEAAGSTVSAASVPTDENGIAGVQVVAGSADANFRVEVSADDATPVTFYVAVSDSGFARLTVTPRYQGGRPAAHFGSIEARLYPGRQCDVLDASAPPDSVYPPRSAAAFDEPLVFTAVSGQEPHTVLAWGQSAAGVVLADGCVELSGDQVRAGEILVDVAVGDRPMRLGRYDLTTVLDTGTVAGAVLPGAHPWRIAACPLGPAQIVVDASLARLSAGTARDALVAARTAAGADGCRGASGGLDGAVQGVLGANTAAALPGAAARLPLVLESLGIDTVLRADGTYASHRLDRLTVDVGGAEPFVEDAVASDRPVIEAAGVPLSLVPGIVLIGEHGLTLRPAWAFESAFEDGVLAPAGLPAIDALVASLVPSCPMVSSAACGAAAQAGDCLTSACQAALPDLTAALQAPFVAMDATGIDLTWQGQARAQDDDLDLEVDALTMGLWSGEITLRDATSVGVTGSFSSAP